MIKKLVFATNNSNKLQEAKNIIGNRIHFLSLNDIGHSSSIEETASSLDGNAVLKAQVIYRNYGLNCFADDTGLEITDLGNQPGVYSARYSGKFCNSKINIQKVLRELKGKTDRSARFKTVIALILNGEKIFFKGSIEGKITEEEKGTLGFGYDSIFIPNGYTKTFAEMSKEMKNTISHRAKALHQLKKFLEQIRNCFCQPSI